MPPLDVYKRQNVIRICARYGNLDILEDGYGINLLPLATFALDTYGDDPCACFMLKGAGAAEGGEAELNMRMHKAISDVYKRQGLHRDPAGRDRRR